MATGLIRDEMSSGTMHYMLTKPIARTEVFFYRVIGYLGIVWPYLIILTLISAIVTGFAGPGDSLFRFSRVWHLAGNIVCCYDGNSSLRHAVLLSWGHVEIWNNPSDSFCSMGIRYGFAVYGCAGISNFEIFSNWLGLDNR